MVQLPIRPLRCSNANSSNGVTCTLSHRQTVSLAAVLDPPTGAHESNEKTTRNNSCVYNEFTTGFPHLLSSWGDRGVIINWTPDRFLLSASFFWGELFQIVP